MADRYRGHPSLEKYADLLAKRATGVVVVEVMVCSILMLSALLGNSLVLWMVCKNKNLRTIPNYFIISLSLADITMAILCQPPCLTVLLVGKRTFGNFICQLQGYVIAMLACVSLLTLTLVAVNRYFLIVRPKNYQKIFTPRRTRFMILGIWLLSMLEPLPYLLSNHRYVYHAGKFFCFQVVEVDFFTLLGYVYVAIPMVVLTFCYIKVFRKLKQHNKKLRSLRRRGFDQSTAAKIMGEDINVTKTLFLTVCAFAICWTPISIVDFIGFAQGSWNLPRQVYVMYTFLGQLSTVVNPIIYGVMNKTFREEYKKLFRCTGNAEITQESEETPQTQESKCSVL
ncbi:melatonin receptor type 1C-like [Acropora millepora]|uniref:melatonin receptor type 1C-like n=1 Tax=Acropora millepora TaxID=45264 RepID=UPI001CF48198|nr:melatonin receptor type 1C-like [Acropora millepora]